jgi:ribonuclease BN (tRNA processing enzyme)
MGVRLRVIGCSPAWPNPGGAHSGYLLELDGRRLLLDCGPGVLSRLREQEEWPLVDAIAITHFHLDHWGDLVPWVWGSWYRRANGGQERPELWVCRGGCERLEELGERLGFRDMFGRTFALHEFDDGAPFPAAGFEVTPLRLPHYGLETYGFRVSAGGLTLAYSGDSAPSERLVELARAVDVFVCEATLRRGEDDGQPRGHLSAEEAVDAFAAAGASRLLLTHRPAELPLADGLEQAFDGMELELRPPADAQAQRV